MNRRPHSLGPLYHIYRDPPRDLYKVKEISEAPGGKYLVDGGSGGGSDRDGEMEDKVGEMKRSSTRVKALRSQLKDSKDSTASLRETVNSSRNGFDKKAILGESSKDGDEESEYGGDSDDDSDEEDEAPVDKIEIRRKFTAILEGYSAAVKNFLYKKFTKDRVDRWQVYYMPAH